jgi:hypothetical protein
MPGQPGLAVETLELRRIPKRRTIARSTVGFVIGGTNSVDIGVTFPLGKSRNATRSIVGSQSGSWAAS